MPKPRVAPNFVIITSIESPGSRLLSGAQTTLWVARFTSGIRSLISPAAWRSAGQGVKLGKGAFFRLILKTNVNLLSVQRIPSRRADMLSRTHAPHATRRSSFSSKCSFFGATHSERVPVLRFPLIHLKCRERASIVHGRTAAPQETPLC